METEEVSMADTHLARQQETLKRELLITGANMTDKEWGAFCEKRQKKIDERNGIAASVEGGDEEAV